MCSSRIRTDLPGLFAVYEGYSDADVLRILSRLKALRMADENIYLRMSSINLFNGMVSLTFSCDGTHYMQYDEFLGKDGPFWF